MTSSVTVDTRRFDADVTRLAKGLERAATDTARRQAETTARQIAGQVPRRTGALAATVAVTKTGDSYGVTYGGGLRYAWPVEKRVHAVNRTLPGAARQYAEAAQAAAAREVSKI